MFVDSHCHLSFPKLTQDRAGVLARARNVGVECMVNACTKTGEFEPLRLTAEQYEDVYFSIGVHPHHAAEEGENVSVEDLVKAASHPKAVGIGETGLDYFYDFSPRPVQQDSFCRHIEAAQRAKLPLIIHTRDAEDDTLRLLKEAGPVTGVFHCFSSRRFLAEEGLAMGFYISLSGMLTFKKSEELRAIARDVPMDRLLIETDSPYLAPEPYRGKPCEPAYVVKTAEVLAEIKGVNLEELGRITTDNFYRLFQKCVREART